MLASRGPGGGVRMCDVVVDHEEDNIDFDGNDSWDAQLLEEAAWMAQQGHAQLLDLNARLAEKQMLDGNLGEFMAAQHDQPPGGPWMTEPWVEAQPLAHGGPWMAAQLLQSHGAPHWMAEQQMHNHGGVPRHVEVVVPDGYYPGMHFNYHGFDVMVPEGSGPGMAFLINV